MNNKVSMLPSVAMAVAFATCVSGVARADDSSLNPFTGDSYASFNGANVGQMTKPPVIVKMSSSWRQANPNGLSERELEALSSEALGNDFQRSSSDKAPSSFTQTHPRGLSVRQLQALSSWAPAWH
jgi:hypothetical protein